jgi:hypothetical protein
MAVVGLSGVAMPETEPLGEPRTSEVGVPAPGPCRPEGGVEVGRRTQGETWVRMRSRDGAGAVLLRAAARACRRSGS